jgi:hypothetical protein
VYKFIGKKGQMYMLEPAIMKLNYNCPADEKSGEGPGSCSNKEYSKQFNNADILKRIKSGGKITQEEHDHVMKVLYGKEPEKKIVPVEKSKKESVQKPSKKTPKSPEPTLTIESGSGLSKIRDDIKKAGGAEKYFKTADTHSKNQEERKPIDSKQMTKIVSLYTTKDTFKTPYKEENGVKWYKTKDMVVAKVGNKIAAYGLVSIDPDEKEPYTTIVAATDFAGKGLGKQAMIEFYDNHPDMIKKTGGLTPMGKKAYLKVLKKISGEE